jgi:hypothetical protein
VIPAMPMVMLMGFLLRQLERSWDHLRGLNARFTEICLPRLRMDDD